METLRIECTGGSFLVDAEHWSSEKTVEFASPGLYLARRPRDLAWKIKRRKHTNYVVSTLHGSLEVRLHRLLLNAKRNQLVDHINHDGTDNRIANIRICTAQENTHNQRSRINASSRFVGVSWNRSLNKWESYVRVNSKKTCLGYFTTEEEAAAARDKWVKTNRPEFGFLNTAGATP